MEGIGGKDCPCPGLCSRKGDCRACREQHHALGEKTYCETVNAMPPSVLSRVWKAAKWLAYVLCPS